MKIKKNNTKLLNRIFFNHSLRKNKFYHKNLYINFQETPIKLIWCKSYNDLEKFLFGYKIHDLNYAIYFPHFTQLEIEKLNISCDVVGTDYNQETVFFKSYKRDDKISFSNQKIKNLIFLPEGTIDHHNIFFNTIIGTKEKMN